MINDYYYSSRRQRNFCFLQELELSYIPNQIFPLLQVILSNKNSKIYFNEDYHFSLVSDCKNANLIIAEKHIEANKFIVDNFSQFWPLAICRKEEHKLIVLKPLNDLKHLPTYLRVEKTVEYSQNHRSQINPRTTKGRVTVYKQTHNHKKPIKVKQSALFLCNVTGKKERTE